MGASNYMISTFLIGIQSISANMNESKNIKGAKKRLE